MFRCAIYVRAERPDEAWLLEQETACRAFIEHKDWLLNESLVFREVAKGDGLDQRPALSAVRNAVRMRHCDLLVVHSLATLSRIPGRLELLMSEAATAKVLIVSATEDPGRERLVMQEIVQAFDRRVPPLGPAWPKHK